MIKIAPISLKWHKRAKNQQIIKKWLKTSKTLKILKKPQKRPQKGGVF